MKNVSVSLVLLVCILSVRAYDVSMFYCGFSGNFCGQSKTDDVNPSAKMVILAFANTNPNGSITVDQANFPTTFVRNWQAKGKKVLLSIGGQAGNWKNVFASNLSITNFVNSVAANLLTYKLDGVDIDIEDYSASPRTVANTILALRSKLGTGKLIVVSPECVVVYQGTAIPSLDSTNIYWNYFVPIIRLADKAIDFYQPQAYNNWYEEPAGSLRYLQNVYLNWRNLKGTGVWSSPIPNFTGVAGEKLLMGVMASTTAGGPSFYFTPQIISQFKSWLKSNRYPLKGFMMWDSHWDSLNSFAVSTVCAAV